MMMVDASVAGKWLFRTEVNAPRAVALLRDSFAQHNPIVVPALLRFEVTNVVRRHMVRLGLSLVDAEHLITGFLALPPRIDVTPEDHQAALTLADQYRLPAAYDAHYLAMALRLGCCDCWADDQQLLRAVGSAMPSLRAIAMYPSLPRP